MKQIELTEEHKTRLLEMCSVLFPEVNCYWEYEMYGRSLKQDFNSVLAVYYKDKNAYKQNLFDFNIHWFEFCITEIVNELSWKNIKTDILADCEYEDFRMKLITNIFRDKLTTEKFHIIDYLYEEFKKLKL